MGAGASTTAHALAVINARARNAGVLGSIGRDLMSPSHRRVTMLNERSHSSNIVCAVVLECGLPDRGGPVMGKRSSAEAKPARLARTINYPNGRAVDRNYAGGDHAISRLTCLSDGTVTLLRATILGRGLSTARWTTLFTDPGRDRRRSPVVDCSDTTGSEIPLNDRSLRDRTPEAMTCPSSSVNETRPAARIRIVA